MEKLCRVELVIVDSNGKGEAVAATVDFNAAMHVGTGYAECSYEMQQKPPAKLFGVCASNVRIGAQVNLLDPSDSKAV